MPSQHKRNPLTLRLPEGLRVRLERHTERTGQPVNRFIADAVREKLDREAGTEIPSATDVTP